MGPDSTNIFCDFQAKNFYTPSSKHGRGSVEFKTERILHQSVPFYFKKGPVWLKNGAVEKLKAEPVDLKLDSQILNETDSANHIPVPFM